MRVFIDFGAESPAMGTHAMFVSTINLLHKILPDAEFTILSLYPEADHKRYGGLGFNLSIVRKGSGRVRAALALMKQYSRADLIVGVYGDGFVMTTNMHFVEFVVKMLLVSLSGKPLVVLPSSIGPFPGGLCSTLARLATRRVFAIAAREETTYEHLIELGISKSRLHLLPDMAFACPAANTDRLKTILSSHGMGCLKRPLIGINVCQPLSFYSQQQRGGSEGYTDILVAVADHVVGSLDASVVLIPYFLLSPDFGVSRSRRLAFGGGFDDMTAIREVYERVKRRDRVFALETYSLEVTELNAIIGQCDLFVGARLHASIAGISSAVPTVAIDFTYKTPGVMKMAGLSEYYCDLRTVTQSDVMAKVDHLWENRHGIRNMLQARVEEFRATINSFLESIVGIGST